jgi:hypothetical protein
VNAGVRSCLLPLLLSSLSSLSSRRRPYRPMRYPYSVAATVTKCHRLSAKLRAT